MSPEEIKVRAAHAQRLLEDPLLKEAFEIIERDIYEMWVACPERDLEGQRLLQQHIRNARKLRDILRGAMESGKMLALQEKSLKDRAREFIRKPVRS